MASLGVLVIATNHYIEYFRGLIKSFESSVCGNNKISFHVFTDNVLAAEIIAKELPDLSIKIYSIPSYGWPEATLKRFTIYLEHFQFFEEDFLMHLDADMLFIDNPTEKFLECFEFNQITLVSHPGFYRPKGLQRTKLYLQNPKIGLRDLILRIKQGGLGSWETNKKSTAYVPRKSRQNYVCGGVWFGPKQEFWNLITNCEVLFKKDSHRALMAKWHDESYLNEWASRNEHLIIAPDLCFEPTYPQLKGIKGLIQAVNKDGFRRNS